MRVSSLEDEGMASSDGVGDQLLSKEWEPPPPLLARDPLDAQLI